MASKLPDYFNETPPSSKTPTNAKIPTYFDEPETTDTWVKPESPSVKEQLNAAGPLFSQEFLAGLWSLPSMAAETYRHLVGKLQGYGEEQSKKEGRELTEEQKNFNNYAKNFLPDLWKKFGEVAPALAPTYQQAKEKVGEKIRAGGGELPEEPRTAIERFASGAGKGGSALVLPGSPLVKGVSLLTSGATEAANLSEGGKIGTNLGIPAATAFLEAIIKKKYIPQNKLKDLYKEGKGLGLSDEQLAPILATEGQVERYGPLAQGAKGTKEAFSETGGALGKVIDDLSARPSASVALSAQAEGTLLQKLSDIKQNLLTKSHSLSPKEQQLVDFLDIAINDIATNGSSPKQIIGTWRSMNKIGQGKTALRQLEAPLLEAIESVDPQIAKDLQSTNALYSRYVTNLKEISPTQFNAFLDAGELQQVLSAVFSPQTKSLPEKLLSLIGLKTIRKISSAMLTDPRAQSLVRNFGQAIRDGRPASARALGTQLQHYVQKNLPEEYEEVDWDKLIPK